MRITANAKINIGLLVKNKRMDGYHDLETFFHKIGLCDHIDIDFYPSKEIFVCISGNESYIGSGMDLMEKALRLFSSQTGLTFTSEIRIEKNIPFKSGLGGGSSDAAAVLLAANSFFSFPLNADALSSLALQIGSDVPFFVSGLDAAKAFGRGEILFPESPLEGKLDIYLPEARISTGSAFASLDAMDRTKTALPSHLSSRLQHEAYPNDFELAFPRTAEIERIAERYSYFSLSGSGSAYFGIGEKTEAEKRHTKSIENEIELYQWHEKIKKIENFLFKSQ